MSFVLRRHCQTVVGVVGSVSCSALRLASWMLGALVVGRGTFCGGGDWRELVIGNRRSSRGRSWFGRWSESGLMAVSKIVS